MRAILRKDILNGEEIPPSYPMCITSIDWTQSYECWQPDLFDDEEFNLVLATTQGLIRVMSIDFEFIND